MAWHLESQPPQSLRTGHQCQSTEAIQLSPRPPNPPLEETNGLMWEKWGQINKSQPQGTLLLRAGVRAWRTLGVGSGNLVKS